MNDKRQILRRLDDAIDRADMDVIEKELHRLSLAQASKIEAEDVHLFACRIQKLQKEKYKMNTFRKPWKIAVIAAVIATMGISVYAANTLQWFSFQSGDQFVTLRTTENMTEDEAKALVTEVDASTPDDADVQQADSQELSFDTVAQAEQKLGFAVALPAKMPKMTLESAKGQIVKFGEDIEKRFCWLNYSDEQGRLFGVTVTREIIQEGRSVTGYTAHDIDEGSLGTYKSKSGIEYTTLSESDETGEKTAHIANAVVGEYEYALVFSGFSEAERHEIIDSVNLSAYK